MEQQRSLADMLVDNDESGRLAIIAELLTQADLYYRGLASMLRGMTTRQPEPELLRDILAALRMTEECSLWTAGHIAALVLRQHEVEGSQTKKPVEPTAPAVVFH